MTVHRQIESSRAKLRELFFMFPSTLDILKIKNWLINPPPSKKSSLPPDKVEAKNVPILISIR